MDVRKSVDEAVKFPEIRDWVREHQDQGYKALEPDWRAVPLMGGYVSPDTPYPVIGPQGVLRDGCSHPLGIKEKANRVVRFFNHLSFSL